MNKKIEYGTAIIIFGATGDLTRRKLIPALYNLYANKSIGGKVPIVCLGRRLISKNEFLELLNPEKFIPQVDRKRLLQFLKQVYYYPLDLQGKMTSSRFTEFISRVDRAHCCKGNRIFYLALPPNLFESAIDILRSKDLLNREGWNRVVFEKPFGYDLSSAREINGHISSLFREDDIYRIDHYLGKEALQNILALRFANSIFEEIWNNRFIDHVQITVAEKTGVGRRGAYYERTGAIRDMLQNHLLQILSLTSMEQPESLDPEHFRDEKVKVFRSFRRIKPTEVAIGQYDQGLLDNKKVLPYRKEMRVSPGSKTETYAALKVGIDNKRWKGVPFYLRTGKRLSMSYAEIDLVLKHVPNELFSKQEPGPLPNVITIGIQPEEGIVIRFNAKSPGPGMNVQAVNMEFCHPCQFPMNSPEAYETLLHEIILGDQTLFTSWDGVEASWKYTDSILEIIGKRRKDFPNYRAGSFGPEEADKLIKRDGRKWCMPTQMASMPR